MAARDAAINATEGCDRATTGAAVGQLTSAVWSRSFLSSYEGLRSPKPAPTIYDAVYVYVYIYIYIYIYIYVCMCVCVCVR